MASETRKIIFDATDLEPIGVQVAGFRVPNPDEPGDEYLAVKVIYTGMTGYIFKWEEEYENSQEAPMEAVRLDIIRSLKDLLEQVETESGMEFGNNVH